MWKYYYSEQQKETYKAANDKKGGNHDLKCRTFVKGKEFTWATERNYLPAEFDDYELVLESEKNIKEEYGEPY